MKLPVKILLLGSGELGKEFVISAQRLGCYVIACDSYDGAPAQQVADEREILDMLDAEALKRLIGQHAPDIIVPEIEAIRTEILIEFEEQGIQVSPSARAVNYTMNRDKIRDLVADELNIRTARFGYAESEAECREVGLQIGYPLVMKPVMSSSGKGQSTVPSASELPEAWAHACSGMRGDRQRVIIEEYIAFEYEITLMTIRQKNGETVFCAPIAHRQERGDYQESWQPVAMPETMLLEAQTIARTVTHNLGGSGIFGVELFVTKDEVIFSELSPRPHDTGMVTLISQDLSEFDLHLRAILGLPIPLIEIYGPSASYVILADRYAEHVVYEGVDRALSLPGVDVRLFGKPVARPYRRMGVCLARSDSIEGARAKALQASQRVQLIYLD
jgi:phosphoribosylglycinamide formyltransferase 2